MLIDPDGQNTPQDPRERLEQLANMIPWYQATISTLSDEKLKEERRKIIKGDFGVGGFLADAAIAREENNRDLARWARGERPPQATTEHAESLFPDDLPMHIEIHPDALGSITRKEVRRFPILDGVTNDIGAAVAARLPRTLFAYPYAQDWHTETLECPELGTISVDINTSRTSMRAISAIKGPGFEIQYQRQTGRTYLDQRNDISFVGSVDVRELERKIILYSDSGIQLLTGEVTSVVPEDGTRGRKITFCAARQPYEETSPWRDQTPVNDVDIAQEQTRIADWLTENILIPLQRTPEKGFRHVSEPAAPQWPDIGPVYTWIDGQQAAKLLLTGRDPAMVFPHERTAAEPGARLVPLRERGYPEIGHDSFIYCGLGEVHPWTEPRSRHIPQSNPSFCSMTAPIHVLARVTPEDAQGAFIADFGNPTGHYSSGQPRYFRGNAAESIIPINEYQGDFTTPVVLFNRPLRFSEVEPIPATRSDSARYYGE